jgi:hypothetical protein
MSFPKEFVFKSFDLHDLVCRFAFSGIKFHRRRHKACVGSLNVDLNMSDHYGNNQKLENPK